MPFLSVELSCEICFGLLSCFGYAAEKDELQKTNDAKLKAEQDEVTRLKAELAQQKEAHQAEVRKLSDDNAHQIGRAHV